MKGKEGRANGKIDPDAYLYELSKKFNCSITAVYKRLLQLGFTYKKDIYLLEEIRRSEG